MPRFLSAVILSLVAAAVAAAADRPVPVGEAASRVTLPAGFKATLFAGEPDVVQPIAFTFDDRGRLWVVECLSYPKWRTDKKGQDRVTILEDTDGDGRFDKRTVFLDNGVNLSGIALGFGGVWLCSTPELVFVPDRDGDDTPDGPPEVVADGWDLKARHNVFNSLTWGPDGWLWGCNGILSNAKLGPPGTPDDKRVTMNCGVWRYHPTRKVIEAVAHGTTNPWGLDFDEYGHAFITNCVIHHLFHAVPGGHFDRMFGNDVNPHGYGLLSSIADYRHWAGGHWTSSRGGKGEHSDAGGGHAHAGAAVYLADQFPAEYRNSLLTCNIHGNRLNRDGLVRKGSGYAARREKDFAFANDEWFRGLAVHQGPEGGVYVSDWCDTGECHNYEVADTSNGRLFRITYGDAKPFRGDLAKRPDAELVQLQLDRNDWLVRHARRLLQERAAAGKLDPSTRSSLQQMFATQRDETRRLRALWALHATGGVPSSELVRGLDDASEYVRGWLVRLAAEEGRPALIEQAAGLDGTARSPYVRLELACALPTLPAEKRWPIAEKLLAHAADATDAYLPLMLWYGVEPLVPADPARAVALAGTAKIPLVREYLARRTAGLGDTHLVTLAALLAKSDDDAVRLDVLRGVQAALTGRRQVPMPSGWDAAFARLSASATAEVRERASALAVLFRDEKAFAALRQLAQNPKADAGERGRALATLLTQQRPDLVPLLQVLVKDPAVRGPAVRGLAAFADPATPNLLLGLYPSLTPTEKADAVATLASRPAYARALLDAMERGAVPPRDVSVFAARQIAGLKDDDVSKRLTKLWGELKPASQDKKELFARYRNMLTPDDLMTADRSRGRALYAQNCASCHKLFGEGGAVGPELTGAQRSNLDYVLENVLDPNAVVPREYQVTVLELDSGRVINGIVREETEKALVVQTPTEVVTVPKAEVANRVASKVSLMPEGLFDRLSPREVRDLVGYLAGAGPVPPLR
jgi:putative membrane-bound dehydrogenase-like protein